MRTTRSFILLAVLTGSPLLAEDWPQFRGPAGDGHSAGTNLPTKWGGFLGKPAWESATPGTGWSSPIVIGDRIWLTAAEQTALDAAGAEKKLSEKELPGKEFQTHASVKLLLIEVEAESGKLVRRIDLSEVEDPMPIHLVNSYASPTPVSDGKHIYCHFGSLGTMAVSTETGEVIWKQQFVVDTITGPACSPILCGDRLILVRDGTEQQYVVALDKLSGKELWRQSRPPNDGDRIHRRGFSTPLVVDGPKRKQIISPTANWVLSYDPETGKELWRVRLADGHAVVPRPVYTNGRVYVCSGYIKPELVAVRVDGAGDVSETHVDWRYDRQVPLLASPIIVGNELYFVSDKGIATCLDAVTGEQVWQERLRGSFAASPLFADGKLYFTSKKGITTVLRPGRQFHKLAENELFGQTMASLAVVNESLLIRTAQKLYSIRKSALELLDD